MNARDKKTFEFIEAEMFRFAGRFKLPLSGVLPMHREKSSIGYYGLCHRDGRIAIRIRWANGRPLHAYAIIDTMAHELAHLRYLTHSPRWFQLHSRIFISMSQFGLYSKLLRRLDKRKS